jgi:hypothetical protein
MYFYLICLKIKLSIKIEKKDFTLKPRLFHYHPRIVFHVKFNFYDSYPDKEILQLSRKYDRLIPIYYLHFVLIAALIIRMVLIK